MEDTNLNEIVQTADHVVYLNSQVDIFLHTVGIQANNIPLFGDQRAAGVSVIDRRINLDDIGVGFLHVCHTGDSSCGYRDGIHHGIVVIGHLVAGARKAQCIDRFSRLRQAGGHQRKGHPLRHHPLCPQNGVVRISTGLINHIAAHAMLRIHLKTGLRLRRSIPLVIQQDVYRLCSCCHMLVGHKNRRGLSRLAHRKARTDVCRTIRLDGQNAHHTVPGLGHSALFRRLGRKSQ